MGVKELMAVEHFREKTLAKLIEALPMPHVILQKTW